MNEQRIGNFSLSNWRGIDLNLLAVFDAVMQDRSLTRAGKRLGLSQPAVSHALTRLRHALSDQLFVRGPDGMVPTPRAEQLADPIRDALAGLQRALQAQAAVPAEMTGSFTIAVNGYTAFALTNRIVDAIREDAPGLRLSIVPSGTRDVLNDLDNGTLDLALAGMLDGGDRFKCARVLTDRYVVVMRSQHPAATQDVSMEAFARLRHLVVTSTGDSTSFVDDALDEAGLTRRIALELPFLAVPEALAASDLVAILPALVAGRLRENWALIERPLPCAGPSIDLTMTWHRRTDEHGEHKWVRSAVRRCLARIGQTG
jgi:DNA-binding transcriptional LysR family regulator